MSAADITSRHPSTQEKMRWLVPNPKLPEGTPKQVSEEFWAMGITVTRLLKDGPQLTIALQRLIDAKDAAVRQAITDSE
jgi:hypothetical protein